MPKQANKLSLLAFALAILFATSGATAQDHSPTGDDIELFSGQTIHGTLSDSSLKITSRLGTIDVPAADVRSLVCQPPPVLSTRGGDILVGSLQAGSIHVLSADGTTMELPLGEVSRVNPQASAP